MQPNKGKALILFTCFLLLLFLSGIVYVAVSVTTVYTSFKRGYRGAYVFTYLGQIRSACKSGNLKLQPEPLSAPGQQIMMIAKFSGMFINLLLTLPNPAAGLYLPLQVTYP